MFKVMLDNCRAGVWFEPVAIAGVGRGHLARCRFRSAPFSGRAYRRHRIVAVPESRATGAVT